MMKAGSPPEDCNKLADHCDVDLSGHYIEIENQFHITVTQHCCQLFLEQESNPGVWAGIVSGRSILIAGQTGEIHSSSIKFTNDITWTKIGAGHIMSTTSHPPVNGSTTVAQSPCQTAAPLPSSPVASSISLLSTTLPLPTIPINPCQVQAVAPGLPTPHPASTSGEKKTGMTSKQIWWAVGSGLAGALGIGAVAGGAALIHHEVVMAGKRTTTTTLALPEKPIFSRKSVAEITTPSMSEPSLRGRKKDDLGLLQNNRTPLLIAGITVGIAIVISVGCIVMFRRRSKSRGRVGREISRASSIASYDSQDDESTTLYDDSRDTNSYE
jgi:hypothetical protein